MNPAGVYEDPVSGRSFTFGGSAFEGEGGRDAASIQRMGEMLRATYGLSDEAGGRVHLTREGGGGKFQKHKPPLRFDVGEEVDVAVDGRSNVPPYRQGWARGVVVETHAYDKGDTNPCYLVMLHDSGTVVPGHRDDPDFIRGVAPEYQASWTTRFEPGDEVECQVGPNEWLRGTVRATQAPFPGWDRGWTAEGKDDARHKGPKDVAAYLVTPKGKKWSAAEPNKNTVMVPMDKDCFVRRWLAA